jgi:RHS repeat-associated protein
VTTAYTWDAEDRLVAVVMGNQRSEFTYDGFSRRVKIVEKLSGVVQSTNKFIWVGGRIAEERNASDVVQKKFYGFGEWRNGVGNLYYARDHLGNLRELTDNSNVVRARYEYDPYGRRTKVSGDLEADWGFTGHYYHAPSTLHLAWFRAYDAHLGRWISRDPIMERGGLNVYAYAHRDPVNYVDPDGRAPMLLLLIPLIYFGYEDIANAPGPGDPTYGLYDNAPHPLDIAFPASAALDAAVDAAGLPPWLRDLNLKRCLGAAKRTKKVMPDTTAQGPHTVWKEDPVTGEITRHETWTPNPKNPTGWDSVQSTDLRGRPHRNSQTGQPVPPPHTQGNNIPGGVRPALPSEIP